MNKIASLYNTSIETSYRLISPKLESSQQELLKIIALIAMTLGHTAFLFQTEIVFLTLVSRMAFPIFAFLMVYNYVYNTSSPLKYVVRLSIVGILAQAPFQMLIGEQPIFILNIMFTLAAGLIIIYALDYAKANMKTLKGYVVGYFTAGFALLAGVFVDYLFFGLILIVAYWAWIKFPSHKTVYGALIATVILNLANGIYSMAATMAFLVILGIAMNVTKGIPQGNKWFFYAYFPAHLIVLNVIKHIS